MTRIQSGGTLVGIGKPGRLDILQEDKIAWIAVCILIEYVDTEDENYKGSWGSARISGYHIQACYCILACGYALESLQHVTIVWWRRWSHRRLRTENLFEYLGTWHYYNPTISYKLTLSQRTIDWSCWDILENCLFWLIMYDIHIY